MCRFSAFVLFFLVSVKTPFYNLFFLLQSYELWIFNAILKNQYLFDVSMRKMGINRVFFLIY